MKTTKEFKIVECSGTAYEIGLQWGEGCRESIHQISENSFRNMELMYKVKKEDVITTAMKFATQIQEFDPYLVDILKGQADSTGLSFNEIVTQRCMNELLFYYQQISGLCTAFAATGKATAGGQTLMGQNIDWSPGATIDFLKVHHAGGPDQYILSFSNSTEYTFSSAGYGICALGTLGVNYDFHLPLACYMPRVMRQKNIHEAMRLLKQVARGLGYFQLADANGVIIGIESTYNDYEVIQPVDDLMLHSNHYLTERFKPDNMMAYMAEKGIVPPAMATESLNRYDRIRDQMYKDYGRITPETAMEALTDHENHPYAICRHDCSGPSPSVTLASFIMVPAEGAIYIAAGNPCEYEYVRYEIG
ncbi:C45 family autoproteolytic acyltransferase/hydolase [Desulfosporosinus nitroreducens]|uniref:C45 family peptidase n=1 Tax=Desulfosporosinus nitroreducens TaxID=2018668 RepID=A0ABT8QWN5_9FIRM|nr:C45 family peptidase [Desulfosporosinus nitroreducens]MDO0825287.1 C45 family peptidase [Desulfosporosinus nitroreducens]